MAEVGVTNALTQQSDADSGRVSRSFDLAITDTLATTGRFNFSRYAGGVIQVPNGETVVTLTFYASASEGGDLDAAHTDAQPPVAIVRTVAADDVIPIPAPLFGAHDIAITGDVAGNLKIKVKS